MQIGIKEIAQEAGVSTATVSLALNGSNLIGEKTKRKVLEIANRLNYRPNPYARSLVTNKSTMIGLIVPDINNVYYAGLVNSINLAVRSGGYGLLIGMSNNSVDFEKNTVNEMLRSRVEGLIISPLNIPVHDYSYIENAPVPKIFSAAHYADSKIPTVECDLKSGFTELTLAAVDNGRSRLVFLTGQDNVLTLKEREEGFFAGCGKKSNVSGTIIRCTDFSYDGACKAIAELIEQGSFCKGGYDAVICANDTLAAGALNTLVRSGYKVPEDIAILGCDDNVFANTAAVRITTLRQDVNRIACETVNMLLTHLQTGEVMKDIRIETKIILRDSL